MTNTTPPPQTAPAADLSRLHESLAVAAIFLLALGLRMHHLSAESVWCDEALTARHLPAPSLTEFLHRAFAQDPPLAPWPAYYVAEYTWSHLFGASILSLRALSITLSMLTLVVLYLRARSSFDCRSALFTLFLAAVALSQIYYAQEIRFYAWVVFFAVLAEASLHWALAGRHRAWWGIHVLCSMVLVFSHAFALLLFPVFFLGIVLHAPRRWRTWTTWTCVHLVLLAAFYFLRFSRYDFAGSSMAYRDVPPTWQAVPQAWLFLTGARIGSEGTAAYLPGGALLELLFAGGMAVLVGAFAVHAVRSAWTRSNPQPRAEALRLLLWAGLPLLLLWCAATLWRPCFFPRYVLYSAPGLFLCAGAGLNMLKARIPRRVVAGTVVAAGLCLALFLPRPYRPDYQQFAMDVSQDTSPVAVVALKAFNALGAAYALGVAPDSIEVEGIGMNREAVLQYTGEGKVVWSVFHHWGALDAFAAWLDASGLEYARHTYGGMPPLYAFRIEAAPGPGPGQRVE